METTFAIINDAVEQNCINTIKALPKDKYLVVIKLRGKSPAQRAYWHNIMKPLSDFTGYTYAQTKYMIKESVLGLITWTGKNGKHYEDVPDSESLDTETYNKLIDATLISASKINCAIPPKPFYGLEERK